MADKERKEKIKIENLEEMIEIAFELGWTPLILTDDSMNPKGIICGPDSFIQEFKVFSKDVKEIEKDLESILENVDIEGFDGILEDLGIDDSDDSDGTLH